MAWAVMATMGTRPLFGQGADRGRRLEAVHHRHLHVHQDHVEGSRPTSSTASAAVGGQFDRVPALRQDPRDRASDWPACLPPSRIRSGRPSGGNCWLARAERGPAGPALRRAAEPGGERERAAVAHLALDADLAAHQFDEPRGDRQAQPRAAVAARGRGVGLGERIEDLRLLLGRHADARVGHREPQRRFPGLSRCTSSTRTVTTARAR